ncbi:MAG: DNA internalization-related competence protein ComEC/Rec2 [Methylovulum sp.]|uniref:DNA internalization-related competence protein ComEC/Rec2 n=1 Tax=Methylovulum sp. TaxID=1916980 RepID=UPI00261EA734|nr:DNA internalization-related competence protein ComEC/Rec2 [Methylovulum sp.]MDD2724195.1 DNA internalization-related competence protein ComEC/Rec2 [Methylovulum sp.]MDD5123226.1 DNA internalization-related competence protein ComEC/Rec2 [Methylovulum sp.]
MILIAPAFLAGILLVQQFAVLPSLNWLILCSIAASVAAYHRYHPATFFCLGILWATLFANLHLNDRLPASLAGIDTEITGTIADLPEITDKLVRFDLAVNDPPAQIPAKIRLSWQNFDHTLKAGQQWAFTVKLKQPHGTLNPGGFDYERWLFTEGIGATGFVRPYPKPMLLAQASNLSISYWRQAINDRLSALPIKPDHIALLKALTIGFGNELTPAQWDIFRQTGTTHLVVISGSHIALIASLVYWLVLKLWAGTGVLRWSPPRVAAAVALAAGIAYAGLAGFSVPTQRAVVMLAVLMLAIIWQRPVRPFHTLALALFAVLVYDPLAVLLPGFWLSYFAVAVIVYAVSGRLGKLDFWREMFHINWHTSLGLSPLLLLFFQQVSVCAPLANAFAVPMISILLVPLALCATLLLFVYQPLADVLMALLDTLLHYLMLVLSWFAQLPLATINHPQPSWLALVLALIGLALLLAPRGMPARYLGLVMLLPLLFPDSKKLQDGELKMTLLDVGQGLATVVQTANHSLVYDTGAKFSPQSDSGQQIVLPFLHQQGVTHLDRLIISHGDNDHIGGAASVLREIPTDNVLTSVPKQLADFAPIACVAGQSWDWDGVRFTVLSPSTTPFVSDNNNSCVVKVASAYGSVLLTGDIEAEAEIWLLKTYREQLRADVLIAAHHGSKTSSTYSFLQTVLPNAVLIPAGFHNPFGHPHPKILQRYREMGIQWLNTADSGAITLLYQKDGRILENLRHSEARYWHFR